MRNCRVFIVPLVFFFWWSDAASTDYYYYGDSGQIALPLSNSMVTVKVEPSYSFRDWSTITQAFDALVDTIAPLRGVFGYDIYSVEEGADLQILLDTLNNHSAIREALPLFQDSTGFILLPNDQLVLKFVNSIPPNRIDSIETLYSINLVTQTASGLKVYETTDSSSLDALQIANLLYESGLTNYSHPDFASKIRDFDPNDPYFQNQYNLENSAFPAIDLDAKMAWEISKGDSSVVVAVLDDGIQSFHEDLDSSKFFLGHDFVGYAYDKYRADDNDPSPDPIFGNGHGMCVAGIISGEINNQKGIAGLAPKCKLMRLKIYGDWGDAGPWRDTLYDWALPSVCARAIEYAYQNGAKVINGSWGWNEPFTFSSITNAVRDASYAGTVLVFSTGNEGLNEIKFPARLYYYGTIAVGAIQKNGSKWDYSNYGPRLTVVAPSGGRYPNGDVHSLDIVGFGGYNNLLLNCPSTTLDYMCAFGGTSAVAPQVAAIAALIFSRRPDYKAMGAEGGGLVRSIIRGSAVDQVGNPTIDTPGRDNYYGYGLVNAFRALLAVSRGDLNNDGVNGSLLDLNFLVNKIYRNGPLPFPSPLMGDCNCDGLANNTADLNYLVNKIFRNGPAFRNPCYRF